jgi:pantetheine-phosphate adenylyltransferase
MTKSCPEDESLRFTTVAVGGTFDEFHKGHRALLQKAFEVGERVLIGLCSDDFARNLRKSHRIAAYDERLGNLEQFLTKMNVLDRTEIIPLNDPYGVTLSRGCVEAIVVSHETEIRAYEINEKRKVKGLPPLNVIVIKMVPAEDKVPISTTRIRRGEINHEGHLLKP